MHDRTPTADGTNDATRFEIRRRLGQGGMGIIYEAFDTQRGIPVAIKTLRNATPEALFRFKQEFRALADVRHPNLITLYELLCIDGEWLFTMELIDGVNLLRHLRPADRPSRPDATDTEPTRSLVPTVTSEPSAAAGHAPPGIVSGVDLEQARDAFGQLALGIQALHQTGHLHRDIKPSNVLVTATGRVVLLDFGVVGFQEGASETIARGRVVGTPTYMSPEQMRADTKLTPANDWYSFGLVLYEALTGRKPFVGGFEAMLTAKLAGKLQPPSAFAPAIPDDLDRLCQDLLQPDPRARASGQQVIARLGRTAAPEASTVAAVPDELVGRHAELSALDAAFARARAGEGGVVYIVGGSGIGKSSLVATFLDRIDGRGEVLILAGRCHEHEAVPYKGVDRLVDELSRALALLPGDLAREVLPDDLHALTRIFPVLRRIEAVEESPPRYGALPDPIELRRQAFAALRLLLSRLAARAPVVLFIDDFQWADPDSATLLAELMSPPAVPPLLLVINSRRDDESTVGMLQASLPPFPPPWHQVLELSPLDREAARALIGALLDEPAADRLVTESGGNPYFLKELLRTASARGDAAALTLDQMLMERVAAVPNGARALVELIAVAGKPTPVRIIGSALARVSDAPLGTALDQCSAQQLIRSRHDDERDLVEPYHDRIRVAVTTSIAEDRRRSLHRALAHAMQRHDSADVEAIASHLEGSGQDRAAADGYARAAAAAAEALAFDRAAALYRRSLELDPLTGVDGATRVAALADALANSGHGADAAQAYQRTVELLERAEPAHPLVLQCRARVAEELLRSGHLDEGLTALATALAAVGLSLPQHDIAKLLWLRMRVRLRRMRFRPRPPRDIPAQELLRIEIAASAATALSNTVHLKGAVFQGIHLLHALRSGHGNHVARGVAFESIFESLKRTPSRKRVEWLLRQAYALAEQYDDPYTLALVRGSHGLSAYQFAEWNTCVDQCREASRLMRDLCNGVWFIINSVEMYELWALYYLGDLAEMSHKASSMSRAAATHGDRYLVAMLSTGIPNLTWLMRNDLQGARHAARDAMHGWSRHGYLQHHWLWQAMVTADLYAGDGASAYQRVLSGWRALKRSLLLNIPMVWLESYDLRARAALATAARCDGAERAKALAGARAAAGRLRRAPQPLGDTLAAMHTAAAFELTEQRDRAVQALREALEHSERGHTRLHSAVVGARLGLLEGDDARRDAALAWMRAEGIVAPERYAAMMYPVGLGTVFE